MHRCDREMVRPGVLPDQRAAIVCKLRRVRASTMANPRAPILGHQCRPRAPRHRLYWPQGQFQGPGCARNEPHHPLPLRGHGLAARSDERCRSRCPGVDDETRGRLLRPSGWPTLTTWLRRVAAGRARKPEAMRVALMGGGCGAREQQDASVVGRRWLWSARVVRFGHGQTPLRERTHGSASIARCRGGGGRLAPG
jgi:hypothetical protein